MNTLKLDITELEIDEHQNEIAERNYDRYFDYNETFKTQVILPPTSNYRNITFDEVTSPFALVIVSDLPIKASVNEFEINNTKMILLNSNIEEIKIANTDNEKYTTVTVYIWGKQ